MMQNQQQYQQAQHQAAQQLRNAAPGGQLTDGLKAMILAGRVPNPFGGFPGMPGGPVTGGPAGGNAVHANGIPGAGAGAGAGQQQNGGASQQARGLVPGVMPQNMAQLGQFGLPQAFDANQLNQILQIQQRAALAGMQGMPPGMGMMGGLPPGVAFNNM